MSSELLTRWSQDKLADDIQSSDYCGGGQPIRRQVLAHRGHLWSEST